MNEHDPLCRRAKIMESLMEGCPECALIVTVRADERAKWGDLSRDNWQDGYEQGQRDSLAKAAQAVETAHADDPHTFTQDALGLAIAAIKAVGQREAKHDADCSVTKWGRREPCTCAAIKAVGNG